jgi:hypothetical protein
MVSGNLVNLTSSCKFHVQRWVKVLLDTVRKWQGNNTKIVPKSPTGEATNKVPTQQGGRRIVRAVKATFAHEICSWSNLLHIQDNPVMPQRQKELILWGIPIARNLTSNLHSSIEVFEGLGTDCGTCHYVRQCYILGRNLCLYLLTVLASWSLLSLPLQFSVCKLQLGWNIICDNTLLYLRRASSHKQKSVISQKDLWEGFLTHWTMNWVVKKPKA